MPELIARRVLILLPDFVVGQLDLVPCLFLALLPVVGQLGRQGLEVAGRVE